MRILDSDKSDDDHEIEKNKKLIKLSQRTGANFNNNNPRSKKKWRVLQWHYDSDTIEESPKAKRTISQVKNRRFHQRSQFREQNLFDKNEQPSNIQIIPKVFRSSGC